MAKETSKDVRQEIERIDDQIKSVETSMKALTLDEMNKAPVAAVEPQTQMSKKEEVVYDAPIIKPIRSISSKEPFNEKYRAQHTKMWERVKCIVENYEMIGQPIETWTKRFAGDPAHFWIVPTNTPIYIPRLLAEQLSNCKYHRLVMKDNPTNAGNGMTFYGSMAVEETRNRIDCRPVGESFAVSFAKAS